MYASDVKFTLGVDVSTKVMDEMNMPLRIIVMGECMLGVWYCYCNFKVHLADICSDQVFCFLRL